MLQLETVSIDNGIVHDAIPGFSSGHAKKSEQCSEEVLKTCMAIEVDASLHFAKELHPDHCIDEEKE